jgi:hypothetical protein
MVNETNPSSKGVTLDGDTILKIVQGIRNQGLSQPFKATSPYDLSLYQTGLALLSTSDFIQCSGNHLLLLPSRDCLEVRVGFNDCNDIMRFFTADASPVIFTTAINIRNFPFRNFRFGTDGNGTVQAYVLTAPIDGSPEFIVG